MKKAWDETRARQLYEEGKSDLDIADMVGASVGAITAWRHRNRLKSKNPTPRKAPERTSAPAKVRPIKNPVQAPAVMVEHTADTANKPNLDEPILCGPVELSFSIAGCSCSLSAPDMATASWAAHGFQERMEAAEAQVKALQEELDDERYRHDRLQDFEVEEAKQLTALKASAPRWINAGDRLPESDDTVLAIVSGKPMPNITLEDAFVLASYSTEDGWIVDEYPKWDRVRVSYWMPLPYAPEDVRA